MELPKKIPFQFGAKIGLRSPKDSGFDIQTTVVGVLYQVAILIQEPVLENRDRDAGAIGGDLLCSYLDDGCLYTFKSRFGQAFSRDVVSIDYPARFLARQLRQHPRARVKLEAESVVGENAKFVCGEIKDISKGGCLLELPGVLQLAPGSPVGLSFRLPNEASVEYLECTMMNIRHEKRENRTRIGVSFSGPVNEIAKIEDLCEMCSYFTV